MPVKRLFLVVDAAAFNRTIFGIEILARKLLLRSSALLIAPSLELKYGSKIKTKGNFLELLIAPSLELKLGGEKILSKKSFPFNRTIFGIEMEYSFLRE